MANSVVSLVKNLHAAIEGGDYHLVNELLDEAVNVKDTFGQTALHVAVKFNYDKVVDKLIDKGADINAKDNKGMSPLNYAIFNIRIMTLRHRPPNIDAIFNCLVYRGVSLDIPCSGQFSPLHAAVILNSSSLVEKLLQRGFPIDPRDCDGMTPLYLAFKLTRTVSTRPINILLDHGADLEAANKEGCTPLQAAVRFGSTGAVQFILAKGASVNSRNNRGDTPLHDAIQRTVFVEKIFILLSYGASLESENGEGRIPLELMFESCTSQDFRIICRNHILKMHTAGLTVPQRAIDRVRSIRLGVDYNQLEEEYHQELKVINDTNVGDNKLGIVLSSHRRPYYMANKELVKGIQELMNSPHFCQTFPNYALILYCTFSKSRKVYNLFHLATRALINLLSPNRVLPSEIIFKIVEVLDDSTKRQLIKSGLCLAPDWADDLPASIQRFPSEHYLTDVELQRLLRNLEPPCMEDWNTYRANNPLLQI